MSHGSSAKVWKTIADARVGPGERRAAVGDRAGDGRDQPGDAAQQGGLAGAGLAEQRDDLALAEGEADAVEHGQGVARRGVVNVLVTGSA